MNVLVIILSILVIVASILYFSALKEIKGLEAKAKAKEDVNISSEIKRESNILNLLFGSEKLYLSESDGRAIIAKAEDVFKSWIDFDFQNWGLNKESKVTPETEVRIYEMVKSATFKDMFTSLSDDLDSLCLTQSQIIDFCEKHRNHLRQDGCGTFFLTKKDFEKPATEDNLFVVGVVVRSGGLNVLLFHVDRADVWNVDCRLRVVVPKLS
jgi:hypothetical protein